MYKDISKRDYDRIYYKILSYERDAARAAN